MSNCGQDNSLLTWLQQRSEIQSILAAVCDLNGTLRGKRLPADQAAKVINGDVRLPLSGVGVDIWGEDIEGSELVFDSGDADGIGEFTGRELVPINWSNQPTALAMMWMRREDGSVFEGDPRRALARILERFEALGFTPVVATELEFYITEVVDQRPDNPHSPITGHRRTSVGVLSVDELQHFDAFLDDVYQACTAQNIPADAAISENGPGQFEINMKHVADALRAADDVILFKRLVRGIARKHGFMGTFMAKPYGDGAGSGFHVHFSLVDKDGQNVFDNGKDNGSQLLQQAVAGLLNTMQENMLCFAPHLNSYRRLMPGTHAPTSVAWAYENRTAAIRIPGGHSKARRIEHRVAGADANPYLVLTSILGGALMGIEQEMTPAMPIQGDAYSLELEPLPQDWSQAIAAFEKGKYVEEIFSRQLQTMFTGCKKQELSRFLQQVTEMEYHAYLEVV